MSAEPTPRGFAPQRAAAACAAGVVVLALSGLGSWWTGRWDWLAFGPDYVPMAPSTALLLLLLGVATFLRARFVPSRAFRIVETACVCLVLGAGILFWLDFFLRVAAPMERWLPRTTETVRGIPVGRMSPLTAACLMMMATALLCGRVTAPRWQALRSLGGLLAMAVLGVSGIFLVGYLAGTPFLYGGSIVPMALLTTVAFALVSAGTLLGSARDAWPLHMFLRPQADARHGHGQALEWQLLALFLILAVGLFAGGLRYLNREQEEARLATRAQLDTIANLKIDQIIQWRRERLADANLIRFTPYVARRALDAIAQPDSIRTRQMFTGWLNPFLRGGAYDRAILLDSELNVRLVHPPNAASAIHDEVRDRAKEALSTRTIVVTDLHRVAGNDPIHLDLMVPLVVRQEGANTTVPAAGLEPSPADRSAGLLVLRVNAHDVLFPLIQSWPTPSPSAETLIVRREGNEVLYLNELRHQHGTAMVLRRPLDAPQSPAARGLRGEQGVQEGVDYRGVRVVAATRPVPGTPWVIVTKVDEAELFAPLQGEALGVVGLALALLLVAALGVTVHWRHRNEQFLQVQLADERERRKLAEHSEHLMKQASDAILLADEHNRILEANDSALGLYGYSLAELLAMRLPELVPTWEQGAFSRQAETLATTGHAVFEALHQRKDRTVFPVEVSCRLVEIGGDRFRLGIIRDITQRKRAEAALRESEEQFRAMFELASIAMAQTDPHTGLWLRVNQRFCLLTGYSADEILQTAPSAITHPDDRERQREAFENVVAGKSPECRLEERYLRKDGGIAWVDLKMTVVRDTAGQPLRSMVTIEDITERKQLEQDRLTFEAHLRQQQKLESIGTLAGGVAHEINNPINGIMNYAQLIQDRLPGDSPLTEYTAEILKETQRVATIVRNLLTFSRNEKQTHSAARILDIVDGTLSLIRTVIRHDQITLTVKVPEDLPSLKCRSQQIQQVLMNLMTNARDALNERYPGHDPDKLLNLEAHLIQKQGRRWIRVTVEDHGTGITPEVRERMFDPFFTTKPRDQGTGLGLAISHGIVKEHHGELAVESTPGQFTRLHVDLPVDNGWE